MDDEDGRDVRGVPHKRRRATEAGLKVKIRWAVPDQLLAINVLRPDGRVCIVTFDHAHKVKAQEWKGPPANWGTECDECVDKSPWTNKAATCLACLAEVGAGH